MDTINYDYQPLHGMPNILARADKGKSVPTMIHPTLLPLLTKLARAKPKWTILTTNPHTTSNNTALASKFEIFEGDESLGTVWRWYSNSTSSGEEICMDNPRLSNKRQRGDCTRTGDTAKAYKCIVSNFGVKTLTELVEEGRRKGFDLARRVMNDIQGNYRMATYRIQEPAIAFAHSNWAAFYDANIAVVGASALDKYTQHYEKLEASKSFFSELESNNLLSVVLRGSDYVLCNKDTRQVLQQSQLSDHVKRCVGMLKLVEDKAFLPGIGARESETLFIIMPEPTAAEEETEEETNE